MPPYEVDALWEILDLPLTYYILIKSCHLQHTGLYLGVIIVQKIPSESLQYNSTTVFMTCNEMAATVSCRHGSHTQVSTLPLPAYQSKSMYLYGRNTLCVEKIGVEKIGPRDLCSLAMKKLFRGG